MEFVLVSGMATMLALGVIQFAFVLHVRNTVADAAAEGARFALLEGNRPSDGVQRTRELVAAAVGESFAATVEASTVISGGFAVAVVRVDCPLTLAGPMLPVTAQRVEGRAARPASQTEATS